MLPETTRPTLGAIIGLHPIERFLVCGNCISHETYTYTRSNGSCSPCFFISSSGHATRQRRRLLSHTDKKSDFENVKPGEKLVLVCKNSDSIKVTDFKDKKQTMELCADGKMLHCTKCKREYRVTWNTPISKGGLPMYATKTVYEQGKPCMFVAKLK